MIRMKVAVFLSDEETLNRFVSSLESMVGDRIELNAFSDLDKAEQFLKKHTGVIFLNEYIKDKMDWKVPSGCTMIYLVDSDAISEVNGYPAFCKYLRADMLYRQLIGIYSEYVDGIVGDKAQNHCSVISFLSPIGGIGTSTIAAGFAVYAAQCGKKSLYINLEKNGDTSSYFFGNGIASISDVLYDIKSKKNNFGMRLESKVSHDDCGVDFLASSPNVLDLIYIKDQDLAELIKSIQDTGLYDFLVLDLDCSMDDKMTAVLRNSTNVVVVNNGRETSNRKMERFKTAIQDLEEEAGEAYTPKFCYFLNKFNRTRGDQPGDISWNLLGGMDEYFGETPNQIIERIVRLDVFDYFFHQ